MTTETDCPSHIEARERLEAALAQAIQANRWAVAHRADLDTGYNIRLAERMEDATVSVKVADLEAVLALLATPTQGKPVAWAYELARAIGPDGYTNWGPRQVTFYKPCVPEGSVRNLTPLYDTPTQEGVGREEIDSLHAQLIEWADRDRALKHSLAQDNRFEAAMEAKGREEAFRQAAAAIEDRSLLPAPKLGEGATNTSGGYAAVRESARLAGEQLGTLRRVVEAKHRDAAQQPAPGAPEGWRDVLNKRRAIYAYKRDDVARGVAEREAFRIVVEAHDILEKNLAALTSSSAKPGQQP